MVMNTVTISITIFALFATILFLRWIRSVLLPGTVHDTHLQPSYVSDSTKAIIEELSRLVPDSSILPDQEALFKQTLTIHWAQQANEAVPACIARPRNADELCQIVKCLKVHFDSSATGEFEGFAVRSGGHSPASGAASIECGFLVDLSLFDELTLSDDNSTMTIGTGNRWADVSKFLDGKGLACIGGRNSGVGVGGLVLGGGLSFFSPRYGFACSNVISYDIVLATGSKVTAPATQYPDLWRALKGGGNNFGIVTRIVVPTFQTTDIWSGFLFLPSFQTQMVVKAFHEVVEGTGRSDGVYDEYVAGPLVSFSYVDQIGLRIVAVNLVSTKTEDGQTGWPTCWKKSPFASLWRLWSTCKVRSLTSSTDELAGLNPPGRRQIFATTTAKNDLDTLASVYSIHEEAINDLRRFKVKDLVWTLVLQPLLPKWARIGDPNPQGLDTDNEPLVIVSYTINWGLKKDDELMRKTASNTIDRMEAMAKKNNAYHKYKYVNYCAAWQNPYHGFGEENFRFLRDTSKKYDPDRFFQKGCVGGDKLDEAA